MSAISAPVARGRRTAVERIASRRRGRVSLSLSAAVVGLVAIGVVMVYSASNVRALLAADDPARYGIQQATWAVLGLTAMFVASRIDVRLLRIFAIPLYWLCLILLVLVLIPGIGSEAGGSRRWLVIPFVGGFQPAELAKLAIVLYLAHWLDRRGTAARGLRNGLIPFALLVIPGFLLIALEPDLGTAGVYIAAATAVFFMSGISLLAVGSIVSAALAAAIVFVTSTPYQMVRIQTFLNPERDPLGAGYNALQALMALALGGLFGLGLGASRQKFLYLPAPSTDFIFAIIGEEWGLIGTLAVLGLFVVIAVQGYRIARAAPDTFSGLLAAGLTTWLVVQACINMMVVTALLPITGIPLPFVSYGGTAVIINLVAVGILLSISRHTQMGSIFDAIGGIGWRHGGAHLPRAGRGPRPARRSAQP
jgi:cell division protein FtsW